MACSLAVVAAMSHVTTWLWSVGSVYPKDTSGGFMAEVMRECASLNKERRYCWLWMPTTII